MSIKRLIVLFIGAFFVTSGTAYSAITISSYTSYNNTTQQNDARDVDIGSLTNGLLVLNISSIILDSGAPAKVSSSSFASSDLIIATETVRTSGSAKFYSAIYYLSGPASGSNRLAVTLTRSPSFWWVNASWWNGAAQTDVLDAIDVNDAATDPTVTVTPTQDNDMFTAIYTSDNNSIYTSFTDTKMNDIDYGTRSAGAGYAIQTTAGDEVMTWSGADDQFACVGAAFKEAAEAGGGTGHFIRRRLIF